MRVEKKVCARCGKRLPLGNFMLAANDVLHKTSKGMREMNYQYTQKFERATMPKLPIQPLLVLCGVRRCSFIVIIRVFDKYFETKIFAKNIDEAESIIENTIVNKEYQIMNIYKAK